LDTTLRVTADRVFGVCPLFEGKACGRKELRLVLTWVGYRQAAAGVAAWGLSFAKFVPDYLTALEIVPTKVRTRLLKSALRFFIPNWVTNAVDIQEIVVSARVGMANRLVAAN
jgi:hypothetical protein